MRKIICRFDNNDDFETLKSKINNLTLDVIEYDLDSSTILKLKKNKNSNIKHIDKYDCNIHYVNMPEFESKKIEAFHKILFTTNRSNKELNEIFNQNITDKTKSIWFPKLIPGKNSSYRILCGNVNVKYPIYIVSKGRSDKCSTSQYLSRMGVKHFVVVEPQEVKEYEKHLDSNFTTILELDISYKDKYDTFDNLGDTKSKGPGAARNFCWDHSVKNGHKFHWVMDDNSNEGFHWLYQNNKIKCRSGSFFSAIENFVDRYENIAIAGLNYSKFCKEIDRVPPYVLNTRIYSFLLIKNNIKYRWRGRYNEDTDLSLRVLKDGWCTIQFNSFLAGKITTQRIKGGNTDEFYDKEGTLNKSKMIKDMHPDLAKVVWKFNRWHHIVNYQNFKQKLKLKNGINLNGYQKINNYGMKIIKTNEKNTTNTKTFLEKKYKNEIDNYIKPIFNNY